MSNQGWTAEDNEGIDAFFNVALGANEDGRLEIYAYSNSGEWPIYHKWQEWGPGQEEVIGFSHWAPLPATGDATYFNNAQYGKTDIHVGLTEVGGACIQVVTQGAWGVAQATPNGNWPGHISRLGAGPSDQTMMSAVARSVQGALYAFGVDQESYNIHYAKQNERGGGWSWHTINRPPNEAAFAVRGDDWSFRSRLARLASPTLVAGGDLDGRIELFYGTPAHIWSIVQTQPGTDNWSQGSLAQFPDYSNLADWTVIQNDPSSGGGIAGRLEVFALAMNAVTGSYTLFHSWQFNSNGYTGWSGWQAIPGLNVWLLPGQTPAHLYVKGPLRAARQQDGSIVIFALGSAPGQDELGLFYIQQNGPHAAFRQNWVSLGGTDISAFDVGQNVDGTLLVVINSDGHIFRRQQTQINSDNWTEG